MPYINIVESHLGFICVSDFTGVFSSYGMWIDQMLNQVFREWEISHISPLFNVDYG